jgi:hypothetical protein
MLDASVDGELLFSLLDDDVSDRSLVGFLLLRVGILCFLGIEPVLPLPGMIGVLGAEFSAFPSSSSSTIVSRLFDSSSSFDEDPLSTAEAVAAFDRLLCLEEGGFSGKMHSLPPFKHPAKRIS